MKNFTYYNPVKIEFGKNTISKLAELIPKKKKVLMTYGGGSIKQNGVYEQVKDALKGHELIEFGGIEANPTYETLMKAVEVVKNEKVDFLLSVGGGSVLDGTKFIAAAAEYEGEDPWDLLAKKMEVKTEKALPIGCVLTLAATGSEMNGFSVVSRKETDEKLAFGSPLLYPAFSVLDPETTYSVSREQSVNGVVDAFVHVFEQYITYDVNSPLQDRQSEAVLKTLILEGPKVLDMPNDYDVRANLMWAATHALNGIVGCGVPQDWATHMIGHEVTALHGLDHARSLAIILPAVLKHQKERKREKMVSYGKRVWHILDEDPDVAFDKALEKTVQFFHDMGMKTRLSDFNIGKETIGKIVDRFDQRDTKLGEHGDIGPKAVGEIMELAL